MGRKKHHKSNVPQSQPKPLPSSVPSASVNVDPGGPSIDPPPQPSLPPPPQNPVPPVQLKPVKMPGALEDPILVAETPVLAAVRALLRVIETYNGSTVNGLISELKSAANANNVVKQGTPVLTKSKLAVDSACAQFIRYATLTLSSIEAEDVSKCREQMMCEGLKYLKRCERSIEKISRWAVTLIFDGARILVHGDSFVVLETLRCVPKNIYFSVFIVLDNDKVATFFEDNYNIDVRVVRDAEVGTLMESMDLVLVGAEAVSKNGGIINRVGTLPLAICSREMHKPMYVLAESFKFSVLYPLNQEDVPEEIREDEITKRIRVDYTPPKYITFLVTDRGLLTPTAVCDELIELYT
ncbi:Translation initiation factor eIF-2B subunit alpha [Orchesella cincta]|uniref:Translation initiation factor eIF2B subunit alpha n=1 Tax=Orchesella cincta TaxID=48709 RepID=A0A1D2MTZ7_ORCCI|nr:Translation initiation factor eIF-2B subunit alpha [Orchesella cincta]